MNGVRAKVLKALVPKGVWAAGCSCLTVAVGWLSVAAEDVAGVDLGLYVVERGVVAVGNDGL